MRLAALVALAAVGVVAVGLLVAALARRRRPRPGSDDRPRHALDAELLDESERRVLDEALAAVAAEHGTAVQRLLASRVAVLTSRRVPVRAIRPSDDPPVVRLGFADGTVLRVRPDRPGGWAPVVHAMSKGSVVVGSYQVGAADVRIVLRCSTGLERPATAVGLDQPA